VRVLFDSACFPSSFAHGSIPRSNMSAIPAADPSCRVSHPFPMHRIYVSNQRPLYAWPTNAHDKRKP